MHSPKIDKQCISEIMYIRQNMSMSTYALQKQANSRLKKDKSKNIPTTRMFHEKIKNTCFPQRSNHNHEYVNNIR